MPLNEEFVKTGHFLFRWRSYLPLFMIGMVLLVMPHFEYSGHGESGDELWELVCLAVSLSGLVLRILTVGYAPKGTSGTNTRKQIAEALNTTGMYSAVRNPLYLGNFIIWFGLSMFFRLWWFNLIVALVFWLYYERIIFAEEAFLRRKFGESYLSWADKTPAFCPSFKNWTPSERAFSFRRAVKNEYKSLFAVIVAYLVLEIMGDVFVERKLEMDAMWIGLFSMSAVMYAMIRFLKKKTKVFKGV